MTRNEWDTLHHVARHLGYDSSSGGGTSSIRWYNGTLSRDERDEGNYGRVWFWTPPNGAALEWCDDFKDALKKMVNA